MASGKNFGFFWGDKKFYLVESVGNIPARTVIIPAPFDDSNNFPSDDTHITAAIQKAIREEHINPGPVKLSLPAGDTIIRSFLIPFMKPNEIASAVEFEVKKYLPFSLKDLAYAYHPLIFTENKIKRIRIIFIAVRREFLDRCLRTLEQAGLPVVFSEPASLSLVRVLLAKKIIPPDQKLAVLQIESKVGRISFVHEGIVIFIREFSMVAPSIDVQQRDPQLIKTRLLNEIHNSLEFYNRQYSKQPIHQMFVISLENQNLYNQWLQEDLGITVKSIDLTAIIGSQDSSDQEGVINAFGVALVNEEKSKVIFNLSRKFIKHSTSPLFSTSSSIDISEYMNAVKTALGCAVVLIIAFFLIQIGLSGVKSSVDALQSRQGDFADSPVEDIQTRIDKNTKNLGDYRNIVFKNKALPIFVYIPSLLPPGAWFKTFDVRFVDSLNAAADAGSHKHWEADLSGYMYNSDSNEAIRMVYDFVAKLKNDKRLGKYFTNIILKSLQRQDINGYPTVFFILNCR
jgi:Tfp pilus assembly PilM family ATPase